VDKAGFPAPPGETWLGRARMHYDQSYNGTTFNVGYGPYTLDFGEKFSIVMAEVVGYGAPKGKQLMGGQTEKPFSTTITWDKKVVIDGEVMTENYLEDYGYPDYINSDVIHKNLIGFDHESAPADC